MEPLIECIPNFSEGKNKETLQIIASAIQDVPAVRLLHQDSGEAAHRTVYTFAGPPEAVIEAAFQAAKVASELIDMRQHKGEHPRIGALDVCPFVPIQGITISELKPLVDQFAKRLNTELGIPVFLYEESATHETRRNLAKHRKGDYEALERRMMSGEWKADHGVSFNAKSGGTVCGVRNFLLAWNMNLKTKDLLMAKHIAYCLRESGWPMKLKGSPLTLYSMHLRAVKAIAWYIADFDRVQISVNLTDFQTTPLWHVFESCQALAASFGTEISGSELIGLIPLRAILACGWHFHPDPHNATDEELIALSIRTLGLDELEEFDPKERILEYRLEK